MNLNSDQFSAQIFGADIEFGVGVIKNLPSHVERFNVRKLLIVTDQGIINAGIMDRVLALLDTAGIEYAVFTDLQPNPTDENVMNGLSAYRKNKCDAILSVGGGSPIDTAKAIGVVASHQGHIREYFDTPLLTGEMPTLIAVPTTSGTGTEVSTGAIITDTRSNRKSVVRSGPPSLALIDPELTVSMPPHLTSATGIDALSHSIEAYVSKLYNPLAGAIALAGIRLVANNLRQAVKDGSDIEARKNMSMASAMGALAFNKGLGAVHSLAHQLSTEANVHHGVANAIMLPYVMEFNLEYAVQQYADIAEAMGANVRGIDAIEAVRQLCVDVGLPQRLRDVGVKEDSIKIMASKAMEDHCHALNPRGCSEKDMIELYGSAF